ncbi:MAG: hypothetical protein OEN01_04080 [Candidatus Krumholzibacteria bacterium]|nr:hypothetical protein [Candidatus Krumholzibacteria bacterium]
MRKTSLLRSTLCLGLVFGLLGSVGCSDDDDSLSNPAPGSPALPSMSTMTMDLSFFGIGGVGAAPAAAELPVATGTKTNWINAATRALFVQLTFYDAFEEPIAAFAAAAHSIPQQQADGSWLWTFIFVEDEIDYGIFLYGQVVDDHVAWRMEVSNNNPALPLDHFVWFDGESMLDDTAGFWQFYMPVLSPPVLADIVSAATPGLQSVRMDWQNVGIGEHGLNVLVNEVGSAEEGDVLAFYQSPTASTIGYHDEDMQEDHNITWYPDGSGSITVPDYNNGQSACWDVGQEDIACP